MLYLLEETWGVEELRQACARVNDSEARLIEDFESCFGTMLGGGSAALFLGSAREGLELALKMACRRNRRDVVVPAFCCGAVGEAIVRAGMRPLLVDSGTIPGSIDWTACEEAFRTREVAAIIVPHLFGMPLDLRPLLKSARREEVVVIEDCASCLDGKIAGKPVGSFGHFAVFSFNYHKPMFLAGGGMLVCNEGNLTDLRLLDQARTSREKQFDGAACERDEILAFLDWLKALRTPPTKIPRVRWEGFRRRTREVLGDRYRYLRWVIRSKIVRQPNEYDFNKRVQVGPVRAALGLALLSKYPAVKAKRIENHDLLAEEFRNRKIGELAGTGESVSPAWTIAKWMLPEWRQDEADLLGSFLYSKGFEAGRFHWPCTLDEQPSLMFRCRKQGNLSNAYRISRLSLDLPIHQNMSRADLHLLATLVGNWLERPSVRN